MLIRFIIYFVAFFILYLGVDFITTFLPGRITTIHWGVNAILAFCMAAVFVGFEMWVKKKPQ